MITEEDYAVEGKVKDVVLMGRMREEDAPAEGHVTLDVIVKGGKTIILECFLDYPFAIDFYAKKYVVGDMLKIRLKLGGDYTNPMKLGQKSKVFSWIERPALLNPAYTSEYYTMRGEIIHMMPHPEMLDSNTAIMDCGIYVYTRVIKTASLKVGDYLQMTGRLDAHVVGKVN